MPETKYADFDGDTLEVHTSPRSGGVAFWREGNDGGCAWLERDAVANLVHQLTEWLQSEPGPLDSAAGCDREKCCGDADGCSPFAQDSPLDVEWAKANPPLGYAPAPTITDEAQELVYGSRQDQYDHPRHNFTRTAILWHGVLLDKLADGESITPEDVALCMVQVKVAREAHQPSRDNRVDGAGYFLCLDRLETGR